MREFGRLGGVQVLEATLESAAARVLVLNFGCVVRDWRVAGGAPVVLGYERFEDYAADRRSMGVIAGRVANRIAGGRFRLAGAEHRLPLNHGRHHLHGGPGGLGRRVWAMEADGAAEAVRLTYSSPDGEEGYPGAVAFAVTMRLEGARLRFEMAGRPDRPTPVNLAQHSYYNPGGGADVLGCEVEIRADRHTPVDAELIPTGEIAPVPERLDFREARRMIGADGAPVSLDANLVLEAGRDPAAPAATVRAPETGLTLRLWTDQPGLQLFNAPGLDAEGGLEGRRYGPYGGLCLEPQHFPDSVNHPGFPSIIATREAPYRQVTTVEIA